MIKQTKKSPNRAETGFSKLVHSAAMNNTYRNMVLDNPKCMEFCCDVLERFEMLLQTFSKECPEAYRDKPVDAFIALTNLERSIKASKQNEVFNG